MEGQDFLMLLLCNYYVTYRCNAYCEFCHFSDHTKFSRTPFALLDDFRRNVAEMRKLGVRFIDLTGGEPLMHPQIDEFAGIARANKMQTSITTNGLLYPKLAEKLAGKINLLHFSLDSPDEDEHNRIRGVNCYKKVFESLDIAKKTGEYPDILFTVTNESYRKLPAMYEIARKRDLVLIINPVFSYFGNPGLSDEAIAFIEEFVGFKTNIYLNDSYLKLRKNGGNNREKPLCKAVSRVMVISPYNEIILPCYHMGNEKVVIDKPIREIRKSEKVKYYRKNEGRFDFCQGCTINCYFEPSFAFPTNMYGISSLKSKFIYGYQKLLKQKVKKKFGNNGS